MGFHNRRVDERKIRSSYKEGGIDLVLKVFSADAIMTGDEISENVADLIFDYYCHEDKELLESRVKEILQECS